jgi:hypothetical protein
VRRILLRIHRASCIICSERLLSFDTRCIHRLRSQVRLCSCAPSLPIESSPLLEQSSASAQIICGHSDWQSNTTQLSYMINYKLFNVVVVVWLLLVVEKNDFKDGRFA